MAWRHPWDVGWDHNAGYHGLVLRRLPARMQRVLDVGCGAGGLAVRLAERADHVDAVDRSEPMVEAARRRAPHNVEVRIADVLTDALPARRYDAVVSISVLHHLDLPEALPRLAATLRPGGRLVAVALPRLDLPRELPVELAAAVGHRVLGAALRVEGAARRRPPRFGRDPDFDATPMLDPTLTTRQVRAQATAALPGARVRRLVMWRYLLEWDKPG